MEFEHSLLFKIRYNAVETYVYPWALPPLVLICWTVSRLSFSLISQQTTVAPKAPYFKANCWPMPCPEPVI